MKKIITIATLLVSGFAPVFASAETGIGATTDIHANVVTGGGSRARVEMRASASTTASTSRPIMQRKIDQEARQQDRQQNRQENQQNRDENKINRSTGRADHEITARVGSLDKLIARIQDMKKLSTSTKATLASEITTEINLLNSLKGKIDLEASSTTSLNSSSTLMTDIKSITIANRVYALIIPQISVLASADRALTLIDSFVTVSAKLQTRINAASSSASTSAMITVIADLNAKIADARAKAQAAITAVTGLTADNGDATVAASNKAALEFGRTDLKAAAIDLQAAQKDAHTILKGLKVDVKEDVEGDKNK